ncbi:hypothetical protein ACTXQV_63305, partial [Klebsiella pneumoniae]
RQKTAPPVARIRRDPPLSGFYHDGFCFVVVKEKPHVGLLSLYYFLGAGCVGAAAACLFFSAIIFSTEANGRFR